MSNVIVRHKHLLAARICTKGARGWWAVHGLDWNDFLTNGIPSTELQKIDDTRVALVIKEAQKDG